MSELSGREEGIYQDGIRYGKGQSEEEIFRLSARIKELEIVISDALNLSDKVAEKLMEALK